jgi:hypothetical protein
MAEALDAMAMLEETVQRKLEQERASEGESHSAEILFVLTVLGDHSWSNHRLCPLRPYFGLHAIGHAGD